MSVSSCVCVCVCVCVYYFPWTSCSLSTSVLHHTAYLFKKQKVSPTYMGEPLAQGALPEPEAARLGFPLSGSPVETPLCLIRHSRRTHAHTHTHTHKARTQTRTHTLNEFKTFRDTNKHAYTCEDIHTPTHVRVYKRIFSNTHARTHARASKSTHTHT